MDDRQAFEEHPKLAAAILRAANEARMPLPLWDKLLGEINAALTAARQDERRKALEEAAEPWARLVWWGPGYGDGVQITHFSGPPEALESEYLKEQLAGALEDATDLFGVEKPPTDTEEGWPLEAVCHVLREEDQYDNSHGPSLLASKGGFYLWRDQNPADWKRSDITSQPAQEIADDR